MGAFSVSLKLTSSRGTSKEGTEQLCLFPAGGESSSGFRRFLLRREGGGASDSEAMTSEKETSSSWSSTPGELSGHSSRSEGGTEGSSSEGTSVSSP